MSEVDALLQQALSTQASGKEEWTSNSKYLVKSQYADDNGPVDISGRKIGDATSEESTKGEALSQYIEFRMSRYYDGIDINNMLIQVHYENQDGNGSDGPVVNMYYNDTEIKFGWIVPNKATQIAGKIKVMVYATGTVDDARYVLKTEPIEYTISDTLTPGGSISEPDNNWYLQFVNRMEAYVDLVRSLSEDTQEAADVLIENKTLIEGLPALASKVEKFIDLGLSVSNDGYIQQTI